MRRFSVLLVLHVLAATVHAQHAPSSLMTAIQGYVGKKNHQERPPFRHALTDLNADGQADAIVLLLGSSWCGSGGCNMLVFRGTGSRWFLQVPSPTNRLGCRLKTRKAGRL